MKRSQNEQRSSREKIGLRWQHRSDKKKGQQTYIYIERENTGAHDSDQVKIAYTIKIT